MKTLDRKKRSSHGTIYLVWDRSPTTPKRMGRAVFLRTRKAIHKALVSGGAEAWLAVDANAASDILAECIKARKLVKRRLGKLVILEPVTVNRLAPAMQLFPAVAISDDRKHWLPMDELLEVLNALDPREFIVGGMVDGSGGSLTLYRGDFSPLIVPLSIFEPSGAGVEPDFDDFEVIDNGYAVRFGKYEAAADAIYYECDPDYRRRYRRKLRSEEKTFGASLRRLRILRALRQSDFTPLPAKTIARIERGEVAKPHGPTLVRIADRLGVAAEEIESY
jgi:hypothetical protein